MIALVNVVRNRTVVDSDNNSSPIEDYVHPEFTWTITLNLLVK